MAPPAVATIRLREGRDKPAREGHPWIFPLAIATHPRDAPPGSVVRVEAADGSFVGWGHYSPASRIPVRVLERREDATVDDAWWRARIDRALDRRRSLLEEPREACRLVFSEADLLPGLVVDRYAGHLVLQIHTPGAETMRPATVDHLVRRLSPVSILDRSDPEHRALEGLPAVPAPSPETLRPEEVTILEGGLEFAVRLGSGQKTGFYIDQHVNRQAVAAWAPGKRVLDAFCYTGAFAAHAAAAGAASVLLVDSSAEALRQAGENLDRNGLAGVPREVRRGNAFEELRRLRDARRTFDLVVLDPPRLAPTRAQASRAARAYKDVNLLAMKLLAPEGVLATFSCSGGIEPAFFREILRWAALDAGREVQVLQTFGQPPDHPGRLDFPESEYLKGLLLRVL